MRVQGRATGELPAPHGCRFRKYDNGPQGAHWRGVLPNGVKDAFGKHTRNQYLSAHNEDDAISDIIIFLTRASLMAGSVRGHESLRVH